ncbi:MAG: hypothetical protein KIC54_08600 [Clostridium sp.]|nr:hypothetical protein [Clostridium sp.]
MRKIEFNGLKQKNNCSEEQILDSISAFSNINIKNASIYLPSGKNHYNK